MKNLEGLSLLEGERLYISDPEQRIRLFSQLNPSNTNLSVAENALIFDLFKDVFQDSRNFGIIDTKYAVPFYGAPLVRHRTGELLSKAFNYYVPSEQMSGVSGVSAGLECLAFALFEPGDKVLIPTPYWQGFKWCFEQRRQMTIIPVNLEPPNFELTKAAVEKAYNEAGAKKPRALVLTNPHNPLGINYPKALLEEIYQFALAQGMHVISDELYCHSQIALRPPVPFTSAFKLDAYQPGTQDRVHVVWGYAKDFGLSGFKAGFVITKSDMVHNKIRSNSSAGVNDRYGWFSPFDSLKNFMLTKLLLAVHQGTSTPLAEYAMTQYQQRLNTSYVRVHSILQNKKIKTYPPTHAAQFFWLDLREFLDRVPPQTSAANSVKRLDLLDIEESDDRENRLNQYIATRAQVTLLPGTTLACVRPGFFRLCFTCELLTDIIPAVNRLADALNALKP